MESSDKLIFERQKVSIILAGILLMILGAFLTGFFWGYRRAANDVQIEIVKTSFADQISYAGLPQTTDDQEQNTIKPVENVIVDEVLTAESKKYYAELIGFGRLKPAQLFADKMEQKGYNVLIKKRTSKTGKGKLVSWYQAVTDEYSDKQALEQLLEAIKQTERLQDIKIKSI